MCTTCITSGDHEWSLLNKGLQDECQIACLCASTKFDEICIELQQGDVSLYDLRKMKKMEMRLRRLCEAVTGQGDKKLSQKDVLECLDQRLQEFDRFSTRQQAYLDICKWIPDPERISGKVSACRRTRIYPCTLFPSNSLAK